MNQIISSILEAENKAEKIVLEANEKAKNIILKGESDTEKFVDNAISSVRSEKNKIITDAEILADKNFNEQIEKNQNSINEIINNSRKNIEKASDKIVSEILG